ncbi:MAG: hypothetical protein ABIS23_02040 [Sphingomicrobium sp.]
MKHTILLLAIGLLACGCEPEARNDPTNPSTDASDALQEMASPSQANAVVPRPAEQAQLDRMILAGYTPHSDHLHPPGVNECPLTKGAEAVM